MIVKYFCENCNTDFEDALDCIFHEFKCNGDMDKIIVCYNEAINKLQNELKFDIKQNNITFEMRYSSYEDIQVYISINLIINFNNDILKIDKVINDSYDEQSILYEYNNYMPFYELLKNKYLDSYINKKYEGYLYKLPSDEKYAINSTPIETICDMFNGKKNKIEIIE